MRYKNQDYEGEVIEISGESAIVEMMTPDLKKQEAVFHIDSLKKCGAAYVGAKVVYNTYEQKLRLDKSLISKLLG
jgi:hypothetical protein